MKKHKKFLLSTLLAGVLALGVVNTVAPASEVSGNAATVPAPIELVEGSHRLRNGLNNDKKSAQGNVTFSSVRLTNNTSYGTACDGQSWRWASVWMGITDEASVDLSTATHLSLKTKNLTSSNLWVKWWAVDADGDAIPVAMWGSDTAKKKGTSKKLSDGTTIASSSLATDWRGQWIGEPVVFTSTLETDMPFSSFTSFNINKVKGFFITIDTWDAKSFDFGTVTATVGGEEVVLWNAENAEQKTYAQVFEGQSTKSMATIQLGKDEWYFGGCEGNTGIDPAIYVEKNVTAVYTKADRNVLEYTKTANSVEHTWTSFYEDKGVNVPAVSSTFNLADYDGFVIDADLTGVTGTSECCFFVKASNVNYRSWGHAYLVADDGTVITTEPGNKVPAGFKGRVVIPFTLFFAENNSGAKLSDDINLDQAAAIGAIVSVGGNKVGDVAKFSNAKIVAEAEKEAAIISELTSFRAAFTMQEGAAVRLDDPSGLRFGANINGEKYMAMTSALTGVTYEFGTVIVPNEAAYENAQPNATGILTIPMVNSGAVEGTNWSFYAAIVNINPANYDRDFVAKAYLQYTVNGDTFTVWAGGETGAYSVYDVAKAAVESGVTDNEYINGIIAAVEE